MGFHPVHDYYGAGDWLWSIFSTALFIGLFVAAIMLLVRIFSGPRHEGPGPGAHSVGGHWYAPGPGPGQSQGPGGAAGPGPAWRGREPEGAERILAERYARGEISEEEYRGRLDVLRQASPGWAAQQGVQNQHQQGQPQQGHPHGQQQGKEQSRPPEPPPPPPPSQPGA